MSSAGNQLCRSFSVCAAVARPENNDDMETVAADSTKVSSSSSLPEQQDLLHPDQLCDGIIPYPKSLSPSSIMEFKKCPQSFLFQYLLGLRQPTSLALAKGSMCHSALEKLFDFDPEVRSLQVLQDLFRSEWSQNRLSDTYRILFEKAEEEEDPQWDLEAEREWGQSGLQLLQNYYTLEDPRSVVRPNPVKREIWLNVHLPIDPELGVTAGNNVNVNSSSEELDYPTFHVRGIVDRIDMIRTNDAASKVSLRIVDYKTGEVAVCGRLLAAMLWLR